MRHKEKALLFGVLLLDYLAIGVLIPIVPHLVFESSVFRYLSRFWQNSLLGLLIAVYPFFQFLSAPWLGKLSDIYGRKKILLICLAGSVIGVFLIGVGVLVKSVALLFLGRTIDGITGGNVSVVFALFSETKNNKERIDNFTLGGIAFGIGFILGPLMALPFLVSYPLSLWKISAPLFLLTALNLFLFFGVLLFLSEKPYRGPESSSLSFYHTLKLFKEYLFSSHLSPLFWGLLLVWTGWTFFTNFLPVMLYYRYNMSPDTLSLIFAYLGATSFLSQALLVRKLSVKRSSLFWVRFSLASSLLLVLVFLIVYHPLVPWILFSLLGASFGFFSPNFSNLLAVLSPDNKKGEVFGIRQSLISLAQIIPPLMGGFALNISPLFPALATVSFFLLSLYLFSRFPLYKNISVS